MKTQPTNFSYFLEKYPFNVIASADTYPVQMRPVDIELNLDKAMTILTIAEEQMEKVLAPIPFMPTDFGFIEKIAEGDNEHQQVALYFREDNPLITLEADANKAMTYEAIKYRDCEEDDAFDFIPEFSVKLFLPNAVIGSIVLQSIGFLPLHNEKGFYENTTVMPDEIATDIPSTEEKAPDTSIPVRIWPPIKFATEEEKEKFEKENDFANTKNLFLADIALSALAQVRSLRTQYKEFTFTHVESAIKEHPFFTDYQRDAALKAWNQEEAMPPQHEAGKAPVKEVVPTEPCHKCNGTGQTGVNLQCLWCEGTGREMNKEKCDECDGSGLDPLAGVETECHVCDGTGLKPENKE
jgi:hypothetical protein